MMMTAVEERLAGRFNGCSQFLPGAVDSAKVKVPR
jgi:hypothetical protein